MVNFMAANISGVNAATYMKLFTFIYSFEYFLKMKKKYLKSNKKHQNAI